MPRSCGVGDEVAAWEPELVVVADAGSEGEQANADPHAEVVQGAGAVSFQAEGALGGLDDRFDALADARDHGCLPGLVFAVGSDDRCAELGCGRFELRAGVALVGDDCAPGVQTASEQADRYLALAAFGRPQGRSTGWPPPVHGRPAPGGFCRVSTRPAASSTRRAWSSQRAGPTTRSAITVSSRPTARPSELGCRLPAGPSLTRRSPGTSRHWPQPNADGTRTRAGGAPTICGGCWSAPVRSPPPASGSSWAARSMWCAAAVGSWMRAGICSRSRTW